MSENRVSWELVQRVRTAIGTPYVRASDTDVANALGISRAAVSTYKHGRAFMGVETFTKAIDLAKIEPEESVFLWLQLCSESAVNSQGQVLFSTLRDTVRGFTANMKNGKSAAGILLAGFMAMGSVHDVRASQFAALSPAPTGPSLPSNVYYVNRRRGRDRRRRSLIPGLLGQARHQALRTA